jgi:hypothetical protein
VQDIIVSKKLRYFCMFKPKDAKKGEEIFHFLSQEEVLAPNVEELLKCQ